MKLLLRFAGQRLTDWTHAFFRGLHKAHCSSYSKKAILYHVKFFVCNRRMPAVNTEKSRMKPWTADSGARAEAQASHPTKPSSSAAPNEPASQPLGHTLRSGSAAGLPPPPITVPPADALHAG